MGKYYYGHTHGSPQGRTHARVCKPAGDDNGYRNKEAVYSAAAATDRSETGR